MKRRIAIALLAAWPGAALADYTLECNSDDYRYTYCPADTRRGVELGEQTSNADCVINDSWGYDAGGVWVDDGCRGRFRIFGAAGPTIGVAPAGSSDPVAEEILAPYREDDEAEGREPGYGEADAILACARYAAAEETARGGVSAMVESVDQVRSRGRRAYDLKFTLAIEEASGRARSAPANCTVENAAVTSYSRF